MSAHPNIEQLINDIIARIIGISFRLDHGRELAEHYEVAQSTVKQAVFELVKRRVSALTEFPICSGLTLT